MKIFVLRGLPGSGKTTWMNHSVRKLLGLGEYEAVPLQSDQHLICSADHFHMVEGEYIYKPQNAAAAHAACLKKYVGAVGGITSEPKHVFVDNTNCRVFELAPYVQLAIAFGHDCEIVHFFSSPLAASRCNVHNVPEATLLAMQRFLQTEELPPWWKCSFQSFFR